MNYNPEKPLISFHIPKCAGTSFSEILKLWFKDRYLENYTNNETATPPIKHNIYISKSNKKFKSNLCIHGHFNDSQRKNYYPDIDQFITVIRHPFTAHISFYYFVKKLHLKGIKFTNITSTPYKIIENKWSIEEYLKNIKRSRLTHALPSEISLSNYKEIIDKKFIFFGITEELQESVNILGNILGYPSVVVPVKNKSSWMDTIPSKALGDFILNNSLDMAIYNYAKSKLLSQIK